MERLSGSLVYLNNHAKDYYKLHVRQRSAVTDIVTKEENVGKADKIISLGRI